MKRGNFTIISNELLEESQLSIPARYLLCVLIRRCQSDEWCYPSQITLGKYLNVSSRTIRSYLNELEEAGLILRVRTGFNRPNTYKVAKKFKLDRKDTSCHLRAEVPLHKGNIVPPNNTYRRKKYNKESTKIKRELLDKLSIK